jgi:hypothetical protein
VVPDTKHGRKISDGAAREQLRPRAAGESAMAVVDMSAEGLENVPVTAGSFANAFDQALFFVRATDAPAIRFAEAEVDQPVLVELRQGLDSFSGASASELPAATSHSPSPSALPASATACALWDASLLTAAAPGAVDTAQAGAGAAETAAAAVKRISAEVSPWHLMAAAAACQPLASDHT